MRRFRTIAVIVSAMLLAGVALGAQAAKVYRWTDKNGVTHYGDSAPDVATPGIKAGSLKIIPVTAEPGAIARLRVEPDGARYLAWADNSLAGPIEVMLRFGRNNNIAGSPALPAR